jgi:hypothetical protein
VEDGGESREVSFAEFRELAGLKNFLSSESPS